MSEQNEFAFARIRIACSTTSYSHSSNFCWRNMISYSHSSNCYQALCSLHLRSAVASCKGKLSLQQYCNLFLFAVMMTFIAFVEVDKGFPVITIVATAKYIAFQLQASKKSSQSSQEELTSLCVLHIILLVRL